jgi:hypothetical protein
MLSASTTTRDGVLSPDTHVVARIGDPKAHAERRRRQGEQRGHGQQRRRPRPPLHQRRPAASGSTDDQRGEQAGALGPALALLSAADGVAARLDPQAIPSAALAGACSRSVSSARCDSAPAARSHCGSRCPRLRGGRDAGQDGDPQHQGQPAVTMRPPGEPLEPAGAWPRTGIHESISLSDGSCRAVMRLLRVLAGHLMPAVVIGGVEGCRLTARPWPRPDRSSAGAACRRSRRYRAGRRCGGRFLTVGARRSPSCHPRRHATRGRPGSSR